MQIIKGKRMVKTLQLGSPVANTALSYGRKVKLTPGRHSYRVLATDAAGNVAAKIGSAKLTAR